jgi:hypothetical protein
VTPSVSRRFVLVGATLTTASLLVPITGSPTRASERKDQAGYEITDWIIIASNGQVTFGLSQPEVGQGSYTAAPDPGRGTRRGLGARRGSVCDRQAGLQDRFPARSTCAEGGRLDVDRGALRSARHRRGRRPRCADPRRGSEMGRRYLRVPDRETTSGRPMWLCSVFEAPGP